MTTASAAPTLRWEPELLARVVSDELEHMAAAGSEPLRLRYRAAAEPLYALAPSEREAAFWQLDLNTAHMLELEQPIVSELSAAKLTGLSISELLLTPASRQEDEGADLTSDEGPGHVTLRIRPSRFTDRDALVHFLRHELAHISDLLEPAFGYDGDRRIIDAISSETLARDRYRTLWCASIDVRLASRRKIPDDQVDTRLADVGVAFGLDPEDREPVRAWMGARLLPHSTLLSCARDPQQLADQCPGLEGKKLPMRRTRCPLCEFPTFPECPAADDLSSAAKRRVHQDFPTWSPSAGLCPRCREVYERGGVQWD